MWKTDGTYRRYFRKIQLDNVQRVISQVTSLALVSLYAVLVLYHNHEKGGEHIKKIIVLSQRGGNQVLREFQRSSL